LPLGLAPLAGKIMHTADSGGQLSLAAETAPPWRPLESRIDGRADGRSARMGEGSSGAAVGVGRIDPRRVG
jgi:hypothetical protein